jgi:hypothetical protein
MSERQVECNLDGLREYGPTLRQVAFAPSRYVSIVMQNSAVVRRNQTGKQLDRGRFSCPMSAHNQVQSLTFKAR